MARTDQFPREARWQISACTESNQHEVLNRKMSAGQEGTQVSVGRVLGYSEERQVLLRQICGLAQ